MTILTAKELEVSGKYDSYQEMMIAFAKIHVEAALKAASENWEANYKIDGDIGVIITVKKESILNAYPLENIK